MHLLSVFLTVKSYLDAFRQKRVPKPQTCPACEGVRLHWHSQYERAVDVREDGRIRRHDLPILVVRCVAAACPQRHHALLPALVYPYRQMGPEVAEETLHRLVTDGTASTESFQALGISPRRIKGWMRWLDRSIPSCDLAKAILERDPAFSLEAASRIVEIAPRSGPWHGPVPRLWRRVAERISLLHAFHGAGEKIDEDPDPSALRSYLRHLWRRWKLILPLAGLHPQ